MDPQVSYEIVTTPYPKIVRKITLNGDLISSTNVFYNEAISAGVSIDSYVQEYKNYMNNYSSSMTQVFLSEKENAQLHLNARNAIQYFYFLIDNPE